MQTRHLDECGPFRGVELNKVSSLLPPHRIHIPGKNVLQIPIMVQNCSYVLLLLCTYHVAAGGR